MDNPSIITYHYMCVPLLRFELVDERLVDDDLDGAVANIQFNGCATKQLAVNLELNLGR